MRRPSRSQLNNEKYSSVSAPSIHSCTMIRGALASRHTAPVLILTSDQSVNSVSAWRDEIEPRYRINLPSREMVRVLADKTLFQEYAERQGFAVPRSVCMSEVAGLGFIDTLRPPLIIKPADKTLVMRGLVDRAVRARTPAEARQAPGKLHKGVDQATAIDRGNRDKVAVS
jgi:predicted ATP-grasp superfamily ATP-dependent carboligase